jgi:magnesium-transporting ATPase (P-type)
VAKEAASMLVLDGNFASIVHAVEEGRAVYANIRRFSTYVLASNMPELAPFILFVLFKMPLALTVMQILAIDLGTDLVPALGLGAETPEPGIMKRPPRSPKERIVNGRVLARAYLWQGGMEILLSLVAFFHAYAVKGFALGSALPMSGPVYRFATTLTLAGIVACQIGDVFGCRTTHESVFKVGLGSNRLVLLGIFGLVPPALGDWAFIAVFPFVMLGCEEARKWIVRLSERRRAA